MQDVFVWNGRSLSRTKAHLLPERVFRFLNAIAQRPVIFFLLSEKGFTEADFQEGKLYLDEVSFLGSGMNPIPAISKKYQIALISLDAWDEDGFLRTKAALEYRHPNQYAYIFAGGLKAAQGPEAIKSVQTYLDRVEMLRSGQDSSRQAHQEEDKKAVELLYQRGILSNEIVQQLRTWLEDTRTLPSLTTLQINPEQQERYLKALFNLDCWFTDWSQTARTAIHRRDYLISLGLASRRKSKTDDTDEDTDTSDPATTPADATATPNTAPTVAVANPATAATSSPSVTATATAANPPKA